MELQVIQEEYTLEAIQEYVSKSFNCVFNFKKEISIFESWRLGCKDKFIPEIWKYRIVKKDGRFIFGVILSQQAY